MNDQNNTDLTPDQMEHLFAILHSSSKNKKKEMILFLEQTNFPKEEHHHFCDALLESYTEVINQKQHHSAAEITQTNISQKQACPVGLYLDMPCTRWNPKYFQILFQHRKCNHIIRDKPTRPSRLLKWLLIIIIVMMCYEVFLQIISMINPQSQK